VDRNPRLNRSLWAEEGRGFRVRGSPTTVRHRGHETCKRYHWAKCWEAYRRFTHIKDETGSITAARCAMQQRGKLGAYTQRRYIPVCGVKVGGSEKKEVQCAIWAYGARNGAHLSVTNPPRRESIRQRLSVLGHRFIKCRYQRRAPDAHPTPHLGPVLWQFKTFI
jgi:hypothetical protein